MYFRVVEKMSVIYFLIFLQGEYIIFYKAVVQCVPPSNNDIQMNFYLSKKSANSTELKGNVTSKIPFDDSLDVSYFFQFLCSQVQIK